MRKLEMAGTRV